MENVIFFFSGTGNSLKVAKTLAGELGGAEIVSMAKAEGYTLEKHYDTVGFVFPTYFWGLPKKVAEFVEKLELSSSKNAYFYSVATYGGYAGNSVYQLYELLLKKHGVTLNYGAKLQMFSNYVVMYNMGKNIDKSAKNSEKKLAPIVAAIKAKTNNKPSKLTKLFAFINKDFVEKVSSMDKNYNINSNCTGCGICKDVCPVKNIEITNGKPQYKNHCEQCIACIQYCPQKAINYKNATQNRRRYTNPTINYREFSGYNR